MAVRIVTDTSSGLPQEIIDDLDITVIDLHFDTDEVTTSGLSTLELVAAYARQLERGGDEGVVALHVAREMSSTYSSAVAASAIFDGLVQVVETGSLGMEVGSAAMTAAVQAQRGGSLEECVSAAEDTLARSSTWVYVHKIDDLRRSGRMSAATTMLSAATLAIKPIMTVKRGKFELAGKTRTQTKAFTKLVELVAEQAGGDPAFVAIQHNDAPDAASDLQELLEGVLAPGSSFVVVRLNPVLALHSSPGAVGVSAVFSTPVDK